MPLNKLSNFIKNTDGRTLYVNPNDLDATDSITNTGNSLAQPFKTIQRALLEAARFSFVNGKGNDLVEKTTILVFPGEHLIDNRPGFAIYNNSGAAYAVPPTGGTGTPALNTLSLELDSNFDLTQDDNILYKFNSVNGGVIIPRGTSIVGLDLRKTKVRPKYVPNPTDSLIQKSAIFRVTGACYFWQFSFFDADESGLVYTHPAFFTSNYQSVPRFSHHKLTCFEYADGVNEVGTYGLTDLDMYYSKLSNAFNSYRPIPADAKFPASDEDFAKMAPEWEIVGAFASDPIDIQNIISGNGTTASTLVTVTTTEDHNLTSGTPIKIKGVGVPTYNVSTKVQNVLSATTFTYLLDSFPITMDPTPVVTGATVTVETDTVSGASPYIFNCSLRSVWGMNGMHADGSKASGFRSMVVAQFTAVSLQKDDRAFVKYNPSTRDYNGVNYTTVYGGDLPTGASQTDTEKVYHLDPDAIYRQGWETSHIKVSNDSFIQIVSVFAIGFNKHFDLESGADASITNSNSNFGQISLNSDGFKAKAFDKDNNAFITSIIPPRDIDTTVEEDIEWLSIDVGLTTSVGVSTHLYLYGLNAVDSLPVSVTQGYRIGARNGDKLYLSINNTEYSANIYMQDGVTSAYKVYDVSTVASSTLTLGSHTIVTGEKIIINSETGDLPEYVTPHIVYYAIRSSSTEIKLATSFTNALNDEALTIYGGTQLKVYSRVSDKSSGDIGSPIQFDTTAGNWYITVNSANQIYTQINALGVAGLSETTDLTYVKRIVDDRSLDEKIYKVRVVIPKELTGAKDPEDGFILQESSTTGARADDFTRTSIASTDFEYNKNPRFITTCTCPSTTVTVLTSLPHGLSVDDLVIIRNVTDSSNPSGLYDRGYNGKFVVASIVDDMSFTYSTTDVTGRQHNNPSNPMGASSTNDINSRTTADQIRDLPRFERNDWQSNLYVYRNEVISSYVQGSQDGIYHLYVLNASNKITNEFTNLEYSQSPVDLYPQLDRDNIEANPQSAKTFALRAPIGATNTSDLKKSITRETVDKLSTTLGIGQIISSVSSVSATSATLNFGRRHGLGGVVAGTLYTPNASYNPGTYYDVKLLVGDANPSVGTWKGATAKVVVEAGGNVSSVTVLSRGSGHTNGEVLYLDSSRVGSGINATYSITTAGISTNIGDVVQVTGVSTVTDGYYRISGVGTNTVSIAKTSGDPTPISGQYAFVVGSSSRITSTPYNSITGITTFTTATPHGLLKGNKFRVINSTNNNLGDYVVGERVGVNTFTAITNKTLSATNGYILKHGYSSNEAISDVREENFGIRQVSFYENETISLTTAISDDSSANTLVVLSINSGIGTDARFPLGSYIQVDNEIMRITSSSNNSQFTVIRGSLGTRKESHDAGSLIRKINPIAVELRRPSILRASGHTFEYLGYGPGNYSTGLPQVQVKSLTEREDFLVQSQERSGGIVVYTGMNNSGDFFSGNTKTSSSSGEVTSYDIPSPTVTGEDPSKSSVVYDEVTVKERLLVEGGDSGTVLSQFDGPVTFNRQIRSKDTSTFSGQVRVTNTTSSDSTGKGALTVKGGVGVGENLNVAGNTAFTGSVLLSNLTDSTSTSTGALRVLGGIGVAKTVTSLGLTVTGNASIGSTLTVLGSEGITSPKFKATTPQSVSLNGTPTFKMLRADGEQDFITFREVQNALGYIPADSASVTGDFPLGNSLICDDISGSFNGSTTDFTLRIAGTAYIPAGSSANLIVSVGGVIQKPGADFLIVTSAGANTSTIRFTTPPASGVNCFIVALGGQGSLVSNIDWDTKGQILVATGNNTAARLTVGANGTVLTADDTQATGVKWAPGTPIGSFFYMAASSADTATGGSATIGATTYHAPEGYLICNGADIPTSGTFQGVNASLLQSLRSFLGSTYGAAGRLPNLINNFAGYSAVPGAIGGSANAIIPYHNHTASDSGHTHNFVGSQWPSGSGPEQNQGGGAEDRTNFEFTRNTSTGYASITVNYAGTVSNEINANLPPYVGMLPVIKY